MILSEKILTGRYGSYLTGCIVMVVSVLLMLPSTGIAGNEPKTVAEIALYQGPDREQILIEGAKKEGQLTFYNSHTWTNNVVAKQFEKKYPFIRVMGWRASSKRIVKRVMEEYRAGRFLVDAIETTYPVIMILQREGVFQEYYTPEAVYYPDTVKIKGDKGIFYMADREIYVGLGFNTQIISPAEAPKTYKDLLAPRWIGKMSMTASGTGIRWIGNALDAMGMDYIKELSHQDITIQNMSGAAMATLVVAGEVPLSPTIYGDNILQAKRRGAPVEWKPLEPVQTNVGFSGITTNTTHSHAAMLFIDYIHSKEGQKAMMKGGPASPREDIGSLEQAFKKTYLQAKYPAGEYEKKYNEWERLLKTLFMKRK